MAQGQGKGDDGEMTLLLMGGIFFLLLWGLWTWMKGPLTEGIRWVKWVEISAFQLVDPSLAVERRLLETLKNDPVAVDLIQYDPTLANDPGRLAALKQDPARMKALKQSVKKKAVVAPQQWVNYGYLAPPVLWAICSRIGSITRWPIALVLIGFGIFYMFYSKRAKFVTHWDLEGLIRLQSQFWKVITPIVDFNPTKDNARNPGDPVPESMPPFAEALSPEEWVAFHNIPIVNKMPEREATRRALQAQLGPRWNGLKGLDAAQRCLFAAFALKGMQRRKESDHLLGEIAACWNIKTGFRPTADVMAEVNRVNNDPELGGRALQVAQNFAYRTTALLGVLRWGRERGGVLAPAAFLWLRAYERELWYPLNNLGRRTYHAEAAGAMAHYMAERQANKALPIPRLETAITTITQYWGLNSPQLPSVAEARRGKPAQLAAPHTRKKG